MVRTSRTTVHPFAGERMMAGNGTVGLEIVEQVPDMTDLFVSIGGGGLMTGVASAVRALRPDVRVWGVETSGADSMRRRQPMKKPLGSTPALPKRTTISELSSVSRTGTPKQSKATGEP